MPTACLRPHLPGTNTTATDSNYGETWCAVGFGHGLCGYIASMQGFSCRSTLKSTSSSIGQTSQRGIMARRCNSLFHKMEHQSIKEPLGNILLRELLNSGAQLHKLYAISPLKPLPWCSRRQLCNGDYVHQLAVVWRTHRWLPYSHHTPHDRLLFRQLASAIPRTVHQRQKKATRG